MLIADCGHLSMTSGAGSQESERGRPHPRQHRQTQQQHGEREEGGNTRGKLSSTALLFCTVHTLKTKVQLQSTGQWY